MTRYHSHCCTMKQKIWYNASDLQHHNNCILFINESDNEIQMSHQILHSQWIQIQTISKDDCLRMFNWQLPHYSNTKVTSNWNTVLKYLQDDIIVCNIWILIQFNGSAVYFKLKGKLQNTIVWCYLETCTLTETIKWKKTRWQLVHRIPTPCHTEIGSH